MSDTLANDVVLLLGGSSGGDGALCALRGEPAAPITTDIGGSE